MGRRFWVVASLALAVALFGAGGCRSAEPVDASTFLSRVVERMSAARTFQAACDWEVSAPGKPEEPPVRAKRELAFELPNRFRVTASPGGRLTLTCVSDGSRYVEYSTLPGSSAATYPAPRALSEAGGIQMAHPMFCGSLLHRFLTPGAKLEHVADLAKRKPEMGNDVTVNGARCRTVRFYSSKDYGNVELAADEDGIIRRITYDSAAAGGKTSDIGKLRTVESYRDVVIDKPIPKERFDTRLPAGMEAAADAATEAQTPEPPVKLGEEAPDLRVLGPGGRTVRLSDFRGRVVLLDFWATWCPPCRESLPETQRLHERFGKRGLAVMAVTTEDRATAEGFCKKNGFTFPIYTDPNDRSASVFKVEGIPTFAVVDRRGRLVSFRVGMQAPEVLAGDLVRAGLTAR